MSKPIKNRRQAVVAITPVNPAAFATLRPDAIVVHQRPDEDSRTETKSCQWTASAFHDGKPYSATSRNGASCALARQMLEAGVNPKLPLRVYSAGTEGCLTFDSVAAAARRSYANT